jgi:tetratricopeptide (TPR) repeat protein
MEQSVVSRFDPRRTDRTTTLHRGFELFGEQMPIVGRRSALDQLLKAFEHTKSASELSTLAISGPEGIGKTRLLFELASRVEEDGGSVYRLRSSEREPYAKSRLAAQVVRHRFGIPPHLSPEVLRERLKESLDGLIPDRRVGDAVRLFGHVLGLPIHADEADVKELFTERSFSSVVSLIKRDALRHPVLVLADRIDEANEYDHTFLTKLVEGASDRPIVVALGLRDISKIPESLKKHATVSKLNPLAKDEALELASVLFQRMEDPPKELVIAMAEKSGGVPGIMEQILRTLASKGIIDTGKRPWVFRSDRLRKTQMPESVEESAPVRINSLDERARGILQKAAIAGPRFWFGGVLALMRVDREDGVSLWVDDRKRQRLNKVLLDLQQSDVIRYDETSEIHDEACFVFQNPHESKLLLKGLNDRTRRKYHRLLAGWMIRHVEIVENKCQWLEWAAYHEQEGGRLNLAGKALLDAAKDAHGRLDLDLAHGNLQKAKKLLSEDEGDLRFSVFLLAGDVASQSGRGQEAVEAYEEALYESVILDDMPKGAEAYVCLGKALAAEGNYVDAAEMVSRARQLYEDLDDQEGVANALDALGRAIWLRGGPDAYAEAQNYFSKALKIRRYLENDRAIASSLVNLGRIHHGKGYLVHARKYFDEALSVYTQLGERWGELDATVGMGATWFEQSEYQRAADMWSRASKIAEEVGDRRSLCILLNNMGEAYIHLEDHASAQVFLREAREIASEVGEKRVVVDAMRNEARDLLKRSGPEKALVRIQEALELARQYNSLFHTAMCRATYASIRIESLETLPAEEQDDAHREISDEFNEIIADLEKMGEDLGLAKVLHTYGCYLTSQGVSRGKTLEQRAQKIFSRRTRTASEE